MEGHMFNQDTIYGDKAQDIIFYLSKEQLDEQETLSFEKLILEHTENSMLNKRCQLPSFGKEYTWLNTRRPLGLEEDLGKKIFLIDFFTYCCINCHHIFPVLEKVEKKFEDNKEFAVIAIHSPKFQNEKSLQQVKEAVLRYKLKHPILNDPETTLWKKFGICCWPTVFVVGPDLILLFVLIGEVQIAKVSLLSEVILTYFEPNLNELDLSSLPICQMKEPDPFAGLLFPASISTNNQDLLVSDTGHDRLLLMSKFLNVKEIIGTGVTGNKDGLFLEASFNSPHGSTWQGISIAYVADTGNHSIRKIDFGKKLVTTVFDGKYITIKLEEERILKFRSPWDVCLAHHIGTSNTEQTAIYIAVAGSHQIWVLDLRKDPDSSYYCQPFAGSGKEENRPNHYRFKAGFAQPSCVEHSYYYMKDHLFVADSESSTIKVVSGCGVKNVVGTSRDPTDLFQFGDKDGTGKEAKLQHPMCVYILDWNNLIIADTYNHKLKVFNTDKNFCRSILTNISFNEPSSICRLEDMLFVVDTNNHRIMAIPINEITAEILPVEFDLEVVSNNVTLEDPPKTVILLPNDGRIFCYFTVVSGEKYILNKNGPQKLDISFKGNKLDIAYRSEKFFGEAQPSLILKPSNCSDNVKGINEPVEAEFVICIPMCEKEKKICCFKKVIFKVVVNDTQSNVKNICLKLNLKHEYKLLE